MSQPSPDARDVVRALDALTTQVRRLADTRQSGIALTPDTADDNATTPDELTAEEARAEVERLATELYRSDDRLAFIAECLDTCDEDGITAVRVARVRNWLNGPRCGRQLPMDPVHILGIEPEAPAADEDAQRTARRNSLRILLARAAAGLTPDEDALLRQHTEAEIREADTARAVARSNLQHVQTIVPEIDRLAAELEQAQERARKAERAADLLADAHRRAEAMERAMESTAADALAHRGCHRDLMAQCLRAERAEAAIKRVRALRDPIAEALERADYRHDMRRGDLADSIMPVIVAALDGTEQSEESTTP
ncbi:hypothetical protein [Streptomyces sp. NPDC013455]|uniref:hypothetical protein n=1 Tax=Streptomyces sp. NPDC013455 TaxID=3155605 RepID=UPI0033E1EE20